MTPEQIQTSDEQLHAAQDEIASLRSSNTALETLLKTAEEMILTLQEANTALAAKEQSIEARASEKAVQIMAGIGQPPVDVTSKPTGADGKAPGALHGTERARAAIARSFEKVGNLFTP